MAFFDWLNNIDTNFFIWLNGMHNSLFDGFFALFTSKEIWFPFYILLIYLIARKYKMAGLWIIILMIAMITVSDQLSNLLKFTVARPRPSHAEGLTDIIHLSFRGRRGAYGFVSAHAANSFALAIFLGNLLKKKRVFVTLIIWATLTAYSRIYIGVHYPLDIIVGGIMGGLIGWGTYKLLIFLDSHFLRNRISLVVKWKAKDYRPIIISLIFITTTLLIASKILLKFNLIS